jgi:hypothetical protein
MNIYEHAMMQAINAARVERGVHALAASDLLATAAARHAQDMATHPGIVHVGSDGSTIEQRIRAAGYAPVAFGEVVAWGWGGEVAPALEWWLNSPDHVGYVLSPEYTEIGVGYATGLGPWSHYWAVDFGRPVAPPPAPPRPYTSHAPIVVGGTVAAGLALLDYLRGDGRAYMVQHPSGGSEKFRTVHDGARFLQLKNSQWEEFWADDAFIWRGVDTSPGDGQYYRQFEDGQRGARWCPRRMTIGQQWESPAEHTVQTYWKGDCSPAGHHRNGRTRNRLTLRARHAAMTWNGVTVQDVIEVGSHTGESMFFGRGYGLCAWSSSWGSSAIAHLLPQNEADNQPEYGCFG